MSSKASFAHHPIHPMLITLPLGLWFTSIACDVIYSIDGIPIVKELAFHLLLAGCLGASVAAVPGLVDYIFIRDDPRVRGTATLHMLLNVVALAIFTADFVVRSRVPEHRTMGGLVLSGLGGLVLSMSAWLGHSLVYQYGVGVEPAKKD